MLTVSMVSGLLLLVLFVSLFPTETLASLEWNGWTPCAGGACGKNGTRMRRVLCTIKCKNGPGVVIEEEACLMPNCTTNDAANQSSQIVTTSLDLSTVYSQSPIPIVTTTEMVRSLMLNLSTDPLQDPIPMTTTEMVRSLMVNLSTDPLQDPSPMTTTEMVRSLMMNLSTDPLQDPSPMTTTEMVRSLMVNLSTDPLQDPSPMTTTEMVRSLTAMVHSAGQSIKDSPSASSPLVKAISQIETSATATSLIRPTITLNTGSAMTTSIGPTMNPTSSEHVQSTKSLTFEITSSDEWRETLRNKSSEDYKAEKERFESALEPVMKETEGFLDAEVIDMSKGSIMFTYRARYRRTSTITSERMRSTLYSARDDRLAQLNIISIREKTAQITVQKSTPTSENTMTEVYMYFLYGVGAMLALVVLFIGTMLAYRKVKGSRPRTNDKALDKYTFYLTLEDRKAANRFEREQRRDMT
ncbi:uncharacterized threonine-rich GPI-anchored glycoprotein PJ4664.02 [Nematostella vectensis]|uniref:uncharacterized threonine-rich GPI-anchored glycoprotein PJ4664.02 n=1 Tax=Nematostella vectensis TaxID=45351 RepID=UPI00207747BC|nr:uncharacterized threonine-rich GPI-anchored glycoprotein PJ4664.02 [Nematostella vectensis]